MNTEWSTGFFIGVNGRTTEYLVATEEGIFSCATIRILPDDEAYDPACIDIVNVTYREYVLEGARSTPVVFRFGGDQVKNADTEPITAPMIPRRARLKPEDFPELGYTVGCAGCDQLQIGGNVRCNHSEACRSRMEAELQKSERGKDRLGKAKDRLDAKTAEMMEEMIDGPSRPKETRRPGANAPADDQPQGENHDSQQEDVIFEDDAEADANDAKM